jgi:hypothetical protein
MGPAKSERRWGQERGRAVPFTSLAAAQANVDFSGQLRKWFKQVQNHAHDPSRFATYNLPAALRLSLSLQIKKPPQGAVLILCSLGSRRFATLRRLDGAHGDLAAAAVFLSIEHDLLALHQPAHAGALERGGVNEDVLAAVIRLNEAEAFLVVIELHGARSHGDILSLIELHLNPRRAIARLKLGSSMFGGSERAPDIQRRRNGPIVRPNVDCRCLENKRGFCKTGR